MKLLPVLVSLVVAWGGQQAGRTAANPVLPGADPHVTFFGRTAWLYPTHHGGGAPRFYSYSSTDLREWKQHGPVLSFSDVKWIGDDGQPTHYAWAPAIAEKGGTYYFYYSVGPQGKTPARLGVAHGKSPAGPFQDSGKPLLTGGNGFEAIDPMVFRDPRSGLQYLYVGGSAGAKLRVFVLSDDMLSLGREVRVANPEKFTEGPFMHYRNGLYYLSYSHGFWRNSSYSAHYSTSSSPTGPWTYRGPILESDVRHKGPGHHSIVKGPGREEWFIVYHRWNDAQGDGPYRTGGRSIAVERLYYEPDGSIRPVRMTD